MVGCDEAGIARASGIVGGGGIAVFPTDTVYGIGCDPYNAGAVKRVYGIKSRDRSKAMPVLAASADAAGGIALLGPRTRRLAERFWPGPLTIISGIADERIREPMGLADKVAVRVPGNGCALKLLERCGPLVGTSANVSGGPPHTDPAQCAGEISGYDVFVDGGPIRGRGESTIIEVAGSEISIVREGALAAGEVMEYWT